MSDYKHIGKMGGGEQTFSYITRGSVIGVLRKAIYQNYKYVRFELKFHF